ncbi:MAG TPA: hypothetical protein VFB73_14445 [Chloroflexota bacterium]|nr:hypothetical protein [Chloroflexota bacterium]
MADEVVRAVFAAIGLDEAISASLLPDGRVVVRSSRFWHGRNQGWREDTMTFASIAAALEYAAALSGSLSGAALRRLVQALAEARDGG